MMKRLIGVSMDFPKSTLVLTLLLTLLFGAQLVKINIDTDPENMLSADQPDRVKLFISDPDLQSVRIRGTQ